MMWRPFDVGATTMGCSKPRSLMVAASASISAWSNSRRTCAGSGSMRSEEHTSELQSLMRISYAVFCLKKKNHRKNQYDLVFTPNCTTQTIITLPTYYD